MNLWRTISWAIITPFLALAASGDEVETVELNAGDDAPDFTLTGSDEKDYALKDLLKEGPVVLAWFPKADTPGCTAECKSLTKNGHLIREFKVQYFMISVDSLADNEAFAQKYGADFAILSDESREVAKAYGVLSKSGYPKRHTFYIGKDGKILKVDRKVAVETTAEDIAQTLAELKVEKNEKPSS